jgi:hypothetical protein
MPGPKGSLPPQNLVEHTFACQELSKIAWRSERETTEHQDVAGKKEL